MARSQIRDFIHLPKMTAAHRRLALHRMLALANERGLATLAAHLQLAISVQNEAIATEQRWREINGETAVHGDGAREADAELDRALSGLYESLQFITRSFKGPRAEKAKGILDVCFPQGVGLVTSLSYIDEHAAVQRMIRQLREADRNASMVALGLTDWTDLISSLNESYGARLVKSTPVTYDDVQSAERKSYSAMLSIIARVLGAYPEDSPADTEVRTLLLKPIEEQEEAFNTLRARKKAEGPPQADKPEASEETPSTPAPPAV